MKPVQILPNEYLHEHWARRYREPWSHTGRVHYAICSQVADEIAFPLFELLSVNTGQVLRQAIFLEFRKAENRTLQQVEAIRLKQVEELSRKASKILEHELQIMMMAATQGNRVCSPPPSQDAQNLANSQAALKWFKERPRPAPFEEPSIPF